MKTILVAEDRDVSRELIEAVLTASGYRVVLAIDGQDALDQASGMRADLVILDLYMPRVDGFSVLRKLRADPNYMATPIIALTASAMAGDRDRALAAGFSEYISKPVNIPLLRSEISRLLEIR
ncbi:MAG TPA: response regulator [Bryobacteraceae bacterium]|nr:response regulator [Bryobacteraceae bacterium]